MEHFLVATISKVHFEVMEQPNSNRVAKTEMECRCNSGSQKMRKYIEYLEYLEYMLSSRALLIVGMVKYRILS
jgi:hypothetical protein